MARVDGEYTDGVLSRMCSMVSTFIPIVHVTANHRYSIVQTATLNGTGTASEICCELGVAFPFVSISRLDTGALEFTILRTLSQHGSHTIHATVPKRSVMVPQSRNTGEPTNTQAPQGLPNHTGKEPMVHQTTNQHNSSKSVCCVAVMIVIGVAISIATVPIVLA
jgi:hypothetical protein